MAKKTKVWVVWCVDPLDDSGTPESIVSVHRSAKTAKAAAWAKFLRMTRKSEDHGERGDWAAEQKDYWSVNCFADDETFVYVEESKMKD